ncbi:hypothetical protein BO78DRAFT_161153 [Aspergillus sclerotiicarbonarius CBS 121057]|uniref:Uncharacterized protein n=1 Tax=Aspergillus sclerotiicarbonarius (strain CBS 121057 / IBT 28362) TaxID=1448318 RepID=A0A319EL58_ASPSB|nr:hypothetical protein BO78DRAFT_161153 [Aspergillus sclerotiicarbonarius CBS 121057]
MGHHTTTLPSSKLRALDSQTGFAGIQHPAQGAQKNTIVLEFLLPTTYLPGGSMEGEHGVEAWSLPALSGPPELPAPVGSRLASQEVAPGFIVNWVGFSRGCSLSCRQDDHRIWRRENSCRGASLVLRWCFCGGNNHRMKFSGLVPVALL